MNALAITGATGRLGRRVAQRLAAAGVPQTLVVRDPDRAPRLPGAGTARAEYRDGASVAAALAGHRTVLMVSAAETPDRVSEHLTFIDAAVSAGVRHLLYTSFFGAARDSTFTLARDHWATEQHLRASGLAFTILRDNLYADFLPMVVGPDNVIRGPAGFGRVSAVAQDDIADVVVAILNAPADHRGAVHDLTGPAALTLVEVAAQISAAQGRAVTYHPETIDEAYASRAGYGAPPWQVDAWVSTYRAIANGEMAPVSSAVPDVTGHPAMSFTQLLSESRLG